MKVGMIQSSYIPWRGYFDFIDDVDVFVFYDDVQYTSKTWRNRNRIKTPQGLLWLSVPVVHHLDTLIQDARIDCSNRWVEKHIRSLTFAYARAPFFDRYATELFAILREKHGTISELNVALSRWVMSQLHIGAATRMSSEFNVEGDKFTRPMKILQHMGASAYLSGPTARAYTNIRLFQEAQIELEFKVYDYPPYPQQHGPFESNVSVLDLLFNCGDRSRQYLKSMTPNERVC